MIHYNALLTGNTLYGTLGIAIKSGPMPNYREFLEHVSPLTQKTSPFIREFWEEAFYCECSPSICKTLDSHDLHSKAMGRTTCTGHEDVTAIPNPNANSYMTWTIDELEKSYTTYLATYAIIHALNKIENCVDGKGLLKVRLKDSSHNGDK